MTPASAQLRVRPERKDGGHPFVLLQLKNGGVSKAKGEGEKEKECTTECKSRRRRDEKAPWALNYESGEGGGDTKERRRGGEKRVMYV